MGIGIINMGLYRREWTKQEQDNFCSWAKERYPNFLTKYHSNVQARWDYRKYLRNKEKV